MNRLKEKLHSVKQHWKQTRGALVTESTFVYPIMFFIVFFMIFFGNMFCIRAGIDQLVTEEAIESAARYADPSLAECEDGIATTLEDAPRVTKNLYRYLDVFDLGGSQSVSTGNIKEGDGTYTGFFSGMNADNIEVVKHHVNNYIVYQTYEVEVHYKLKFPWKFIFNDERIYIPMIARAEVPVTDSAEFIRNVDMAIDMFERSEGGEDFFANADIIYGKVQDFLNGENANGEAVAGGIKRLPEYHLTTAPDRSKFTCGYDAHTDKVPLQTRIKCSPREDCDYGVYEAYGGTDPSRGNGLFIPNNQTIFDGVFPGEGVKNDAGQYGVVYKDGIPDFSPYAVAEVKIDNMNEERKGPTGNFRQADIELAKQWGLEELAVESGLEKEEAYKIVEKWREDHDYTWHELNDTKTVQLVPTALNGTCRHLGGTSESKYQ